MSPKNLKNHPKKSNSPFPSMSAAGLLGPNLVFLLEIINLIRSNSFTQQLTKPKPKLPPKLTKKQTFCSLLMKGEHVFPGNVTYK